MDDFKLISRMVIFHLGEINNIMIFSSGNELKIIHYVQTWPPDVKNELLFLKKAIFSTKNAQFEKF